MSQSEFKTTRNRGKRADNHEMHKQNAATETKLIAVPIINIKEEVDAAPKDEVVDLPSEPQSPKPSTSRDEISEKSCDGGSETGEENVCEESCAEFQPMQCRRRKSKYWHMKYKSSPVPNWDDCVMSDSDSTDNDTTDVTIKPKRKKQAVEIPPKNPPAMLHRRIGNRRQASNAQFRPTRNISYHEQRIMIEYLIETNTILLAKGNRVWQQMVKEGRMPMRTYQSLQSHFCKLLLPKIEKFKLTPKVAEQFYKLRKSGRKLA